MQGAHDLGRTPGLVDAQVGDKVRRLEAAIATGRRRRRRPENSAGTEGSVMICVLRGASAAIVADKPLPNWAV